VSRVPAGVARRLDRLAWRLHAFHLYAHHPLCHRYAGEVLTLGRVRVCKGCTLLAVGVVVGVPVGCLVPALSVTNLALVALAALAWALAVFLGPGLRPLGKLGTRFLPATAAAFLAVQGLRVRQPWGLALVAVIAVAVPLIVRVYRRRGPHRAACEACPERDQRLCSGFRLQYRRERAFQRLAARMINVKT